MLANSLHADDALLGHWKLAGSAEDASPEKRHAVSRGVDFTAAGPGGAARTAGAFNGREAFLEVPTDRSLKLGTGEFTIAAWVNVDDRYTDCAGEIASQFDLKKRRGFNLGISHNAGITTTQANARQVHFGIDNDRIETEWTDHGRPGTALLAFALCVYRGDLYSGTCEPGKGETGHVYRLVNGREWLDCGSPDPCNSVSALAVFGGELYAGVAKYRVAGSALAESENLNPGGKVYRYAGGREWIDCGQLPQTEAIGGLVVFDGHLYATSLYKPAGFFRYEGGSQWTALPVPNDKRVDPLAVYNGQLFAGCYDQGHVFRYDGQKWTDCGQVGDTSNTQTYSFIVYGGKLYVGTWASGKVYRYDGDNQWADVGRLGEELEVMGMLVHNGSFFAGSLPLAEVYRCEGEALWRKVGRVDHTPDVKYRRAWTMAEFQGRLFCSALPSGKVWSLQAGRCVTSDHDLSPGWHHVVAVRERDRLRRYVDGKQAATSATFDPADYDLSAEAPLKIGFGPTDYFHGHLSDVRVYGRALTGKEVGSVMKSTVRVQRRSTD